MTNLDIKFSGERIRVLTSAFWCEGKRTHHRSHKLERNNRKDLEAEIFLSPNRDAAPARQRSEGWATLGWATLDPGELVLWRNTWCLARKPLFSLSWNHSKTTGRKVRILAKLEWDGVLPCLLGDITSIWQKGSYPVSSSGCYNCGLYIGCIN